MESRIFVFESIDLNHATHLPAEFRRNACGINVEGFHVIGFDLGTKAGRTVVGERNAVEDELGLIFGAAWVKNRIAFIEPAWFRVHQVLHGTAGQRGQSVLNRLQTQRID